MTSNSIGNSSKKLRSRQETCSLQGRTLDCPNRHGSSFGQSLSLLSWTCACFSRPQFDLLDVPVENIDNLAILSPRSKTSNLMEGYELILSSRISTPGIAFSLLT